LINICKKNYGNDFFHLLLLSLFAKMFFFSWIN
jgi:hypothetical protein